MFERFEPASRQAVLDARHEADRVGQDMIRTEHLLLGVLQEAGPGADALSAAGLDLETLRAQVPRGGHRGGGGIDADALATLGISLDAVRRATDAAFGHGALDRVVVPSHRRIPLGDDTKQALAGAVRYAHSSGERYISSGHLLVGILEQEGNGAVALLNEAGTDIDALRADVLRRVAPAA